MAEAMLLGSGIDVFQSALRITVSPGTSIFSAACFYDFGPCARSAVAPGVITEVRQHATTHGPIPARGQTKANAHTHSIANTPSKIVIRRSLLRHRPLEWACKSLTNCDTFATARIARTAHFVALVPSKPQTAATTNAMFIAPKNCATSTATALTGRSLVCEPNMRPGIAMKHSTAAPCQSATRPKSIFTAIRMTWTPLNAST
jgi:hypothetical protein